MLGNDAGRSLTEGDAAAPFRQGSARGVQHSRSTTGWKRSLVTPPLCHAAGTFPFGNGCSTSPHGCAVQAFPDVFVSQPWMGCSAALLLELQTPVLTTNHEAPTARTATTRILLSFTNPDLL